MKTKQRAGGRAYVIKTVSGARLARRCIRHNDGRTDTLPRPCRCMHPVLSRVERVCFGAVGSLPVRTALHCTGVDHQSQSRDRASSTPNGHDDSPASHRTSPTPIPFSLLYFSRSKREKESEIGVSSSYASHVTVGNLAWYLNYYSLPRDAYNQVKWW